MWGIVAQLQDVTREEPLQRDPNEVLAVLESRHDLVIELQDYFLEFRQQGFKLQGFPQQVIDFWGFLSPDFISHDVWSFLGKWDILLQNVNMNSDHAGLAEGADQSRSKCACEVRELARAEPPSRWPGTCRTCATGACQGHSRKLCKDSCSNYIQLNQHASGAL